jgi:hypothetical protein
MRVNETDRMRAWCSGMKDEALPPDFNGRVMDKIRRYMKKKQK